MTEAQPKRWNKVAIIAFVLLLVTAVGGGAVFAFFINTPKNHYFKAEATTFEQTEAQFNERFANMVKYNELLATKPSNSEMTLKGSLEAGNNFELMMFQDVLNKLNIVINEQRDPEQKFIEDTVSLSFDESKPLEATFFVQNNKAGIHSKDLSDKAFFVKESDVGKLLKRFNETYNDKTKYDFNRLFEQRTFLTEEEIDYLTKTYGEVLQPYFKDESFIEGEGSFDYEGKKFTATKITWSATGSETKKMLQALVKKAIKDEKLFAIIERISSSQSVTTLNSEISIKSQLTTALKDIAEEIEDKKFGDGIASTIYVNDDNIILKREIELKSSTDAATISTYNVTVDGKDYDEFVMRSIKSEEQLSLKNIHSGKKDRFMLTSVTATENMTIGVETEELAKDHYRFTLVSEGEGEVSTLLDSTEIALDVKTNFDFDNDKASINYKFHLDNENEAMKLTVESTTKSKFGSAKQTIKLSSDDMNIATASDERLNKALEDVVTKATEHEFVQAIQQTFMSMMFSNDIGY